MIDALIDNLTNAQSLLYRDFDSIRHQVAELTNIITAYAKDRSPIYQSLTGIIDKSHLSDRAKWYVDTVPHFKNKTSGTTGNAKFEYCIWSDVYHAIEAKHHYQAILDEFGIRPPLKVLYCLFAPSATNHQDVAKIQTTDDIIISHGVGQGAEVHRILAGPSYFENNAKFYEKLITYAIEHKIDVLTAQGTTIASLAWNIARLGIKDKVCRLLSNTGSKLNLADAESLKDAGVIDDWCDHMRCWDGGATFITCKHSTYHLQDALAYVGAMDGKLISTDYYSLASPFINYWNGDYCTVDNQYQRCKCGRAYREFVMGRTRDPVIYTRSTATTRAALLTADGGHKIKRIQGYNKQLLVVVKEPLKMAEADALRTAARKFDLKFAVER